MNTVEREEDVWPDELNPISEKIIGCAFKVSSARGVGVLGKVYENALAHELRKAGLLVEQQRSSVSEARAG